MSEPIEQIWAEMGRRGLGGMAGSNPGTAAAGPVGVGLGIGPRTPQATWAADRALGALINVVPRASAFVRGINAGPVADGTLDHARRMGWVR